MLVSLRTNITCGHTQILYLKNSTVYVAGRSATNGETAIEAIKKEHPTSTGTLKFLHIDLSDLATVKPAAEEFMRQESRLDVVWHNAGIMLPPDGTVDKHVSSPSSPSYPAICLMRTLSQKWSLGA